MIHSRHKNPRIHSFASYPGASCPIWCDEISTLGLLSNQFWAWGTLPLALVYSHALSSLFWELFVSELQFVVFSGSSVKYCSQKTSFARGTTAWLLTLELTSSTSVETPGPLLFKSMESLLLSLKSLVPDWHDLLPCSIGSLPVETSDIVWGEKNDPIAKPEQHCGLLT